MDDVFPRRELGSSDHWGRIVEQRIEAVSKVKEISELNLFGTSRANSAGAEELARNLRLLEDQIEQTRQLVAQLPATGSAASYASNFTLSPGWQTVTTASIPAVLGKNNLDIKGMAVVRIVDPGSGGGGGAFGWPFDPRPISEGGTVTSEYGPRDGRMHEGIDFGVPEGTPIPASNAGTVIDNGYGSGTGFYVDLDHGSGIITRSFHMVVQSDLAIGTVVSKGQTIGLVGNTGNSFGAHLHWETIVNGVHQNPRDFMAVYGDGGTAGGGGVVFSRPRARLVLNGQVSRLFFPHRDVATSQGTLNQIFPLQLVSITGTGITAEVQVYSESEVPANPGNFARLTLKGVFRP